MQDVKYRCDIIKIKVEITTSRLNWGVFRPKMTEYVDLLAFFMTQQTSPVNLYPNSETMGDLYKKNIWILKMSGREMRNPKDLWKVNWDCVVYKNTRSESLILTTDHQWNQRQYTCQMNSCLNSRFIEQIFTERNPFILCFNSLFKSSLLSFWKHAQIASISRVIRVRPSPYCAMV